MNENDFEFLLQVAELPAEKRSAYVAVSARSKRDPRSSVLTSNVLDVLLGQEHGGAAVNRWHSLVVATARKSIPSMNHNGQSTDNAGERDR